MANSYVAAKRNSLILDGPRIPSPDVYRSSPSSPSRSPNRHSRNFSKSFDPLLRDLSPSTTLRAFTAASSSSSGTSSDQLVRSIESASASERSFGARIAQTCKHIRGWYEEVQHWEWPGTFEPPPESDRAATRIRLLDSHRRATPQVDHGSNAGESEFWGSLPREVVISHEQRVEEIRDALEELEVEELKDHVLNAHTKPKSLQSAYDAIDRAGGMATNLQRLDDFTALITATILQALPYLSHLNKLLNSWSVRLVVLRKVPGFLSELHVVQQEIETSWSTMACNMANDQLDATDLRTIFERLHATLGRKVSKLGARLDSVLDDLEGREETLPDDWIDNFETLEASYGEWVMHTQREVMTRDLGLSGTTHQEPITKPMSGNAGTPAAAEYSSDRDAARGLLPSQQPGIGLGLALNGHIYSATADHATSTADHTTESVNRVENVSTPTDMAESPILGTMSMARFDSRDDEDGTDSDREPSSAVSSVLRDDKELLRRSVPPLPEVDLSRSARLQTSQNSSANRSRYLPIVVGYDEKEVVVVPSSTHQIDSRDHSIPSNIDGPSISELPSPQRYPRDRSVSELPSPQTHQRNRSISSTVGASPALEDVPQRSSSNNVRARAAFLNGGLEQTQTLQRANAAAPVRPFEHASSAFTKLFNRANAAQHSRSNSGSSRSSSLRKGLGIGGRKEPGKLAERSSASNSSLHSANSSQSYAEPPITARPVMAELEAAPLSGSERSPRASHTGVTTSTADLPHRDAFVTPETQFGFEPSTGESRSTIESSWSSPPVPTFPENWPLPQRLNENETVSPSKTIDTGHFERMFVDSLPTSPEIGQIRLDPMDTSSELRPATGSRRSSPKRTSADQDRGENDYTNVTASSRPRHVPIMAQKTLAVDKVLSPVTTPGSFISNLSTPDVQSASAAGYFKSKEVTTPPPNSRRYSPSAADHGNRDDKPLEKSGDDVHEQYAQSRPKRASVASIENFARSALKTIDIPEPSRRTSTSSNSPSSPFHSTSSPIARGQALIEEAPVLESTPGDTSPTIKSSVLGNHIAESEAPPLNLAMHKRRKDLVVEASPSASKDEPISLTTPVKMSKHKKSLSNTEQLDRHVSRVLSSLPNRIRFTPLESENPMTPEPIKGLHNSSNIGSLRNRPTIMSKFARRPSGSSPGLTLSPAKVDEKARKSKASADPEVKLYHLSQEGERQPIKLYVRLVGEGERVMVRVGGGWADLGEYLRQYAEHHGHRTVSDGRVEVSSVEKAKPGYGTSGSAAKRTPISRPGSVLDQRPTSRISNRRRSSLAAVQQPFNTRPESPAMVFAMDNYNYNHTPTRPSTATTTTSSNGGDHATKTQGTPTSLTLSLSTTSISKPNSRPSTADGLGPLSQPFPFFSSSSSPSSAAVAAAPSSSWSGTEIGLAGPASSRAKKSKKDRLSGATGGVRPRDEQQRELDEHKARWVEDMIDRAKAASVEKISKSRKVDEMAGGAGQWGSIGQVGGTRRVVFKRSGGM